MSPTPAPAEVGGYRLLKEVGRGGFGSVHLGEDARGRRVAVKLLHVGPGTDPRFFDLFAREVEAARRVSPFCVAQVLDADPKAAQPWIVSEFVDGPTLSQEVRENGPAREGSSTCSPVRPGLPWALRRFLPPRLPLPSPWRPRVRSRIRFRRLRRNPHRYGRCRGRRCGSTASATPTRTNWARRCVSAGRPRWRSWPSPGSARYWGRGWSTCAGWSGPGPRWARTREPTPSWP